MADYTPIPNYEYRANLAGDRYPEMTGLFGVPNVSKHFTHLTWPEALAQRRHDEALIDAAKDNYGIVMTILGGLGGLPSMIAGWLGWSASKGGPADPAEILALNPNLEGLTAQQVQEVWSQMVDWFGPGVVEPPDVVAHLGLPGGAEHRFDPMVIERSDPASLLAPQPQSILDIDSGNTSDHLSHAEGQSTAGSVSSTLEQPGLAFKAGTVQADGSAPKQPDAGPTDGQSAKTFKPDLHIDTDGQAGVAVEHDNPLAKIAAGLTDGQGTADLKADSHIGTNGKAGSAPENDNPLAKMAVGLNDGHNAPDLLIDPAAPASPGHIDTPAPIHVGERFIGNPGSLVMPSAEAGMPGKAGTHTPIEQSVPGHLIHKQDSHDGTMNKGDPSTFAGHHGSGHSVGGALDGIGKALDSPSNGSEHKPDLHISTGGEAHMSPGHAGGHESGSFLGSLGAALTDADHGGHGHGAQTHHSGHADHGHADHGGHAGAAAGAAAHGPAPAHH